MVFGGCGSCRLLGSLALMDLFVANCRDSVEDIHVQFDVRLVAGVAVNPDRDVSVAVLEHRPRALKEHGVYLRHGDVLPNKGAELNRLPPLQFRARRAFSRLRFHRVLRVVGQPVSELGC